MSPLPQQLLLAAHSLIARLISRFYSKVALDAELQQQPAGNLARSRVAILAYLRDHFEPRLPKHCRVGRAAGPSPWAEVVAGLEELLVGPERVAGPGMPTE